MKLTKDKLRQIIKEELEEIMGGQVIDNVKEMGLVGPLTVGDQAFAVGKHPSDPTLVQLFDWSGAVRGAKQFIKDMPVQTLDGDLRQKLGLRESKKKN